MKINKLIIYFFITFLIKIDFAFSEIYFESSNIEIKSDENIILAYDSVAHSETKQLKIKSKKAKYDKKKQVIFFHDEVIFKDSANKLLLDSNKITYKELKDIIYSDGETNIVIKNKYKIKTENIYYDRKLNKIYGSDETFIEDKEGNIYKLLDKFEINILKENIKSSKAFIIDTNNNKYIFENLFIDLQKKEIAGKELKVEFEDTYFGNKNNDPVLKGRSAYSNDQELRVYKAVFSTCNIENKKCRGWELNTEEFNHNKEKKLFEYKNSWLKILNYKVFYLPYFNHPDPTVKRKSGFLTPSYSSSETLGTSINIPYFKVLGADKDITFNPRYYADKSFLIQNEYRQALKNSKVLSDFSFLVGERGTKGHLFYNQIGQLNKIANFQLNLQQVKGDNYLKNHKLKETSSLIMDENLLLTNFDIDWNFKDSDLKTSFKIYEDLSRNYHDRFQYIFPDFNFTKNISIPDSYDGNFSFNSYGYNKNYDTNVTEAVITNDFLFSSNPFINSYGVSTDFKLLLKNSNNYSNNSSNFEENANYDLFTTLKIDTSLPMQRKFENFTHQIKPIVSFRFSPNGNSDISSKDILLNYDNVFSLNRIGTAHEVEGGESLSLGLEFNKLNNNGLRLIDFKVANVLKSRENYKLPKKSKLNKTRSDIFGNLDFSLNDNLKFGYSFSHDRDLKHSNLEQLDIKYSVNNFFTNFSYYTEDNNIGNKENIKNKTSFNFNDENKLSFEIAKNLKDDFTQFYNLMYVYETDCISFNINYNKSFFRDGNLEPNKSISFLVKIIPFTELGVSNVRSLIGR